MKLLLLLLSALSLFPTAAYADTVQLFNYEGTFNAPPGIGGTGTVSGTITIDTTTGVVTDAGPFLITLPNGPVGGGPLPITSPPFVLSNPGSVEIYLENIPGFHLAAAVDLDLPVTTLVGYTGGILCTESTLSICSNSALSHVIIGIGGLYMTSGSIAPVTPIVATPEPSTLALLGTGVFALAGTIRRRLRP